MLRRPTSSPETLLYASESPDGAGPSWCTRTSLVAQTAGHATVAEVAHEAVARARLIPEDVRFVTAKEVTGYGVVGGLRRSDAEGVRRDYDPARDRGGARGDVAREVVGRKLHATRATKRDPDPREVPVELRGSTRVRVVLYSVACHLEVIHGFGFEGFEEHASAVVADFVSEDGAAVGVGDEDAPRAARDVVADNLRVLGFLACQVSPNITDTAHIIGEDLGPGRVDDFRADPGGYEVIIHDGGVGALEKNIDRGLASGVALDDILHDFGVKGAVNKDGRGIALGGAYKIIVCDLGVDAPANDDPAGDIAYGTVSRNSSVASTHKVDSERRFFLWRFCLETPDREATNAHVLNALFDLEGIEVHVAQDANGLRSESPGAGRVCFGGRLDHGVVSAQLYPVLADHHSLAVDSTDDDGVARIGGIDSLLDGLARPNDRALRSGGADPSRQSNPASHQQG